MAELIHPPPATHVLYEGPCAWQKLPPGAMWWSDASQAWFGDETTTVSAVPGHRYAIPLNVSLPPGYTPPDTTPDILEEARDLIQGDRATSYGDAKESFTRIAKLWSAYRGVEITPKDVASMMILLKVSRSVTSAKRDNWVDVIGYAALGAEMEGGQV